MPKKMFKDILSSGKTIIGTFLQLPAGEVAEIAGYAGLDFAIIDVEHGMLGVDKSVELVRGCDAVDLPVIYRVEGINHHRIGQALDFGASAVMVPNIKSKEDAQLVVKAAKYHPQGDRGVCPFTRGAKYNAADEDPDYYQRCNERLAVVLQIEATEGMANLDSILDVPYIDAIFIGPFDLSHSLGIPGKVTDERVLKAISQIVEKAKRKDVVVGNFPVTLEQARCYMRAGVRFLAYGDDTLILQRAYRDICRSIRKFDESIRSENIPK